MPHVQSSERKKQGAEKAIFGSLPQLTPESVEVGSPTVERIEEIISELPIFIPTLSSPEPDSPQSVTDTSIQSHANSSDIGAVQTVECNQIDVRM